MYFTISFVMLLGGKLDFGIKTNIFGLTFKKNWTFLTKEYKLLL